MQGSSDGKTWSDIWKIDANISEGWNSKNFENDKTRPAYNQYRFNGATKGSCRISEATFVGVESVADGQKSYKCEAVLNIEGVETPLKDVVYESTSTPVLTSISPRFGSVRGKDKVTLTGTGFSASAETKVFFDNRECKVTEKTTTKIVCTTSDKPYVADTPITTIQIAGTGNVATKGLAFRYVSLYSDERTWKDFLPIEGESIHIPKGQQLLVDVDTTPKLKAVIVEGALIFPPNAANANHHRTFDAHYIVVRGGYFEAGTADFPYTSKLTITMHSDVSSPYLPIYGNKVIAVRFGHLEMHGIKRTPVWTSLEKTANANANTITLKEKVDW